MRTPFIAGNWKMNLSPNEAQQLAIDMVSSLQEVEAVDIAIAPTFLALPSVIKTIQGSNIFASAQNCHQETSGAYTGEISTAMLRNAGCTYVIIGHSERRQYFKESNQLIGSTVCPATRVTGSTKNAGASRNVDWHQ